MAGRQVREQRLDEVAARRVEQPERVQRRVPERHLELGRLRRHQLLPGHLLGHRLPLSLRTYAATPGATVVRPCSAGVLKIDGRTRAWLCPVIFAAADRSRMAGLWHHPRGRRRRRGRSWRRCRRRVASGGRSPWRTSRRATRRRRSPPPAPCGRSGGRTWRRPAVGRSGRRRRRRRRARLGRRRRWRSSERLRHGRTLVRARSRCGWLRPPWIGAAVTPSRSSCWRAGRRHGASGRTRSSSPSP